VSSGRLDDKVVTFEINHNRIVGRFALTKTDADGYNPDRIRMSLNAESYQHPDVLVSTVSVMINKNHTKILAGFFRDAANVMEKWYKENE